MIIWRMESDTVYTWFIAQCLENIKFSKISVSQHLLCRSPAFESAGLLVTNSDVCPFQDPVLQKHWGWHQEPAFTAKAREFLCPLLFENINVSITMCTIIMYRALIFSPRFPKTSALGFSASVSPGDSLKVQILESQIHWIVISRDWHYTSLFFATSSGDSDAQLALGFPGPHYSFWHWIIAFFF